MYSSSLDLEMGMGSVEPFVDVDVNSEPLSEDWACYKVLGSVVSRPEGVGST